MKWVLIGYWEGEEWGKEEMENGVQIVYIYCLQAGMLISITLSGDQEDDAIT